MSESDVCRRQILTSKDGPLTERVRHSDAKTEYMYIFKLVPKQN